MKTFFGRFLLKLLPQDWHKLYKKPKLKEGCSKDAHLPQILAAVCFILNQPLE